MLWGENRGKWKSRELNPGHLLAWAASALPLSHDSRTTTNPHNPLWVRQDAFSRKCMVAWDFGSIATWLRGWSPRTRVVFVNHKSQTTLHYVLCYVLQQCVGGSYTSSLSIIWESTKPMISSEMNRDLSSTLYHIKISYTLVHCSYSYVVQVCGACTGQIM